MSARTALTLLRITHAIIFVAVIAATVFVAWAALAGFRGPALAGAIALVSVEGVILAVNRLQCPLTLLARRLGSPKGWALDIVLPESWARSAMWIFGGVFASGLALLVLRG